MDGKYADFGRKVYVFEVRRTIAVEAENATKAMTAAARELERMMAEDLDPDRHGCNFDLRYLGRKMFNRKTHADEFVKEES